MTAAVDISGARRGSRRGFGAGFVRYEKKTAADTIDPSAWMLHPSAHCGRSRVFLALGPERMYQRQRRKCGGIYRFQG